MYINWAHHYIPKFNGILSVLVNSLFIYIVHDDKVVKLGSYRFLLIFFALYNFTSTAVDLLVPTCVINHDYLFSFFIVDGVFEKRSTLGTFFISFRCCIISAAYCILHCHFLYRYMLLFWRKILEYYFMPYGLLLSVAYCLVIMTLWFPAAHVFAEADDEHRNYVAARFREQFNVDIFELNVVSLLFSEASSRAIRNSWIGLLLATTISVYSVTVCIVFGAMIIVRLQSGEFTMSSTTKRLQSQLIKALIVQSSITMVVCFCPCIGCWYMPVFGLEFSYWVYWSASVALSFFPVLDPLALFYFVPVFQKRMREIFGIKSAIVVDTLSSVNTGC